MIVVKFRGRKYLLVGDMRDAALATIHQYEHGLCSFAHLQPDGIIRRFQKVIGKKEDLEVVGTHTPNLTLENILPGVLGPSWRKKA